MDAEEAAGGFKLPDFVAIKRLGRTDLGWFKNLYHLYSNSNLKGINLNADVLIGDFYRDLAVIAGATENRIPVTVTMFGPAGAPAYSGTYKLVKSPGSKNWRLNGTLVSDPFGQDNRFDILVPNDIAVIAFDGRPTPTNITLILLAAADPKDAPLHAALSLIFDEAGKTMVSLMDPNVLLAVMGAPNVAEDHPLGHLLDDGDMEAALEDAVQGELGGIEQLQGGRGARRATPADVERASREMARVGAAGEALVNTYLALQREAPTPRQYEWSSAVDTYAPYDFRCISEGIYNLLIDVKTTKKGADQCFHMSRAEVVCAAKHEGEYHIYRLHRLTDDGATLRISEGISDFAKGLLEAHDGGMPTGVMADSFSISVDADGLTWGDPIDLPANDIEEPG